MANPEHLKILKKGVEVWNKWRKNGLSQADLSSANLSDTDLINVNFFHTDLSNTNLSGATIDRGYFNSSNLSGANLSYSSLFNTIFIYCNFSRTGLLGADLSSTIFKLIHFDQTNLRGAHLDNTIFFDSNLSNVKSLETCRHTDFSFIDHITLAQSGNLPISFLRGCGLPDFIIENISALRNNPIIFYSCFISYSSKDEEFANRLYSDLQDKGIRCWYAPEKMKGGKKIYDQINEAIRMHDKLLLVLSEESMNSEWVATEIKKARAREKQEKRQMLFPIGIVPYEKIKEWELFEADSGTDLAAVIREYHIPDFSEWKKHDSYKKGFERVVRDLKGEKASPT